MVTLKRMRSIDGGLGAFRGGRRASAPAEGQYPRDGIDYRAVAVG